MIKGSFVVLALLTVFVLAAGRKEKGQWQYRGLRRILREERKRGRMLPEWLKERMIVRTWFLLLGGSFLLNVWELAGTVTEKREITRLERPEYGQGSIQEELELTWESENGMKGEEKMLVEVRERTLTEAEEKEMMRQVKERLKNLVLGENTSADHVDKPLYLPEKVDGFPVSLTWNSSNPEILDWEGKPGEEISEKGELVCLTAAMKIGKTEDTYFQYVNVFPMQRGPEEELKEQLRRENQGGETAWLELPGQVQGRKLSWKRNRDGEAHGITIFVFLCPFLLLMRDKQTAQEKKKRERQQLEQDYPEILSKLTLLLNAGVNLRRAMERIGQDYEKYQREKEKRKAYEMILETCGEMNRGVSEKEAYERLGEKCGTLQYRTLSSLLVRHLQKGNPDIERMLEKEAEKAQQMRQQQARVLGEQASAKLLFPMILMLLVVFVILMVPAWMTFAV